MSEPRRLGSLGKGMLGLGVVLALGLVGLTAKVMVHEQRVSATQQLLADWSERLRRFQAFDAGRVPSSRPPRPRPWQRSDRSIAIPSGQAMILSPRLVDAWNRPILYRCPGPVHRHGWDLYSVGPNGLDEQGDGDDLVVGEDFAPVTSGS